MNDIYNEIVKRLHWGVDPWDDFVPGNPEIHNSWGSLDPCFKAFIHQLNPELVIEVGSFLGGSAINMAGLMKSLGRENRCIICADTWLAEEVLWSRPVERSLLRIVNGSPTFYKTFMSNVATQGHSDTIIPLRMPSLAAGRYLKLNNIKAPFIYIDGSHIEGDVIRDLEMYWDILLPGGVMLVDDFNSVPGGVFDGVVNDCHLFSRRTVIKLESFDSKKAFFRKP